MLQDLQLFYKQVTQTSSRAWIARARNKSGSLYTGHHDRCIIKFAGQDRRLAGHVLIFLFASIFSDLVQVWLQTSTFLSKHKIVWNNNFAREHIFTLERKARRSCVSAKRQYLPVRMNKFTGQWPMTRAYFEARGEQKNNVIKKIIRTLTLFQVNCEHFLWSPQHLHQFSRYFPRDPNNPCSHHENFVSLYRVYR
jgi:hypothetical protein